MDNKKLARATNTFGINLLRRLAAGEAKDRNVFISPSSIAFALSMTLNGASGETRKAMASALGVGAESLDEVNAANTALIAELRKADPKVRLEIANALFTKAGYPFNPAFLDTNKQHYGAEVSGLDFTGDPDGCLKRINGWCGEHTNHKIEKILDRINPAAAMFLVNAIYFFGPWQEAFPKDATQNRDFRLLDGNKKSHPTMMQFGREYPYLETEDFQAASLPYGDGRLSMCVLLPRETSSLSALLEKLDAESWDRWMSQLQDTEGTVLLPRFKLEFESTLNDVLAQLGMGVAFDRLKADFSGMVPPPDRLCIDEVKHKTFVDVTEEGTEAAAVTSVGMIFCTSIGPAKRTFVLKVNRPFLCAIRDRESGAVLFLGAIVEPK